MSLLHLAEGSSQPPLVPDLLRVYSMKYCPYAQRTRLVLKHKNVPHDTVNINLKKKPEWFLEKTPFGLVPVIEYDGHIIYESAICDDWLDDVFPEPHLTATSPYKKAEDRIVMAHFDRIAGAFYEILRNGTEEKIKVFDKELLFLEKSLKSKFFGGDHPGVVDFYTWPWFERLPLITNKHGYNPIQKDTLPNLFNWIEAMKEVPAVKEVLISTEEHTQFLQTYLNGEPNYDIAV